MGIVHGLLGVAYPALRIARRIRFSGRTAEAPRLRVLLYHDIPPSELDVFERHIRWLATRWTFIGPEQFTGMISGRGPVLGNSILLTFDDGFLSNRVVADSVLRPLNIKAVFFVVSELVSIANRSDARRFISRHVLQTPERERLPEHLTNMGWSDLEALLMQGHTIGCHTRTHARLSASLEQRELHSEIIQSANDLQRRLGTQIDHFAYTFGDVASFCPLGMALAQSRFRYLYSGLRGDNATGLSPYSIRRDSLSPRFSRDLVGAFLEGGADCWYRRDGLKLDSWAAHYSTPPAGAL